LSLYLSVITASYNPLFYMDAMKTMKNNICALFISI